MEIAEAQEAAEPRFQASRQERQGQGDGCATGDRYTSHSGKLSHLPGRSFLRVSSSLPPPHATVPPSHRPTASRPKGTDRPAQTPGSRRLSGTPHSKALPQIISPCQRRLPQHYLPMYSPLEPIEFWRVPFSRLHQPLAVKWIIPVIYILLLYMNLATPSRDHLSAGHRFSFPFLLFLHPDL